MTKLIAGNWKMFKGPVETLAFFDGFEAPDGVDGRVDLLQRRGVDRPELGHLGLRLRDRLAGGGGYGAAAAGPRGG